MPKHSATNPETAIQEGFNTSCHGWLVDGPVAVQPGLSRLWQFVLPWLHDYQRIPTANLSVSEFHSLNTAKTENSES